MTYQGTGASAAPRSVRTRRLPSFFIGFGIGVLSLPVMLLMINSVGLWLWGLDGAGLYWYQLDKLKHLSTAQKSQVDTVLVGDSSLGNAVDARLLSDLTNSRAVNLALTGNYGYLGSFNMLRRAADAFPNLHTAVIMQTLDVAGREPALDGWALTSPSPVRDVQRGMVSLPELARQVARRLLSPGGAAAYARLVLAIAQGRFVQRPSSEIDFIPQAGSGKLDYVALPPTVPEKLEHLRVIAEFCAARDLRCGYTHGPLAARVLAAPVTQRMLAAMNREVMRSGLTLLNRQPLALTAGTIGDSVDHVRPDRRVWSTKWFAAVMCSNDIGCRNQTERPSPGATVRRSGQGEPRAADS